MAFIKSLAVAVYTRVLVNYKSTLVGCLIAVGVLVADQTVAALQALPAGWAQVVASLVALVGAYLKGKAPPAPAQP